MTSPAVQAQMATPATVGAVAAGAVAAGAVAVGPTPACIRPRRVPVREVPVREVTAGEVTVGEQAAVTAVTPRRSTARQMLEAALAGVRLGGRDRQFLARLVHWDKRSATAVASLLERAREAGWDAGRASAALTHRQLELVVAALGDAAVYRASGTAAASCWDCELVPGGRCADHARDFDRAGAYTELARALSVPSALPGTRADLPWPARGLPTDLTDYRHRAPVAS
ncbi:MAG: hypothetical protein ACRDNZ_09865 [Streptosporangiaceae bacterium]